LVRAKTLHADAYRVLNKTVTGRKLPAETFGAGTPLLADW
jgi:hypothetical protein